MINNIARGGVKKIIVGNAVLYNGAMEDVIKDIDHADCIFTDPPYLYITTHKFDRKWDEELFFEQAGRILPDDGLIALFGRGTSFYRWNMRLAELGFIFREEFIWNKVIPSSPIHLISRVHETVSVHGKTKAARIRKRRIPYVEAKQYDIPGIIQDIKRIKGAIGSEKGLKKVLEFVQNGFVYDYKRKKREEPCVTFRGDSLKGCDVGVQTLRGMQEGIQEKEIIEVPRENGGTGLTTRKKFRPYAKENDQLNVLVNGVKEKSIVDWETQKELLDVLVSEDDTGKEEPEWASVSKLPEYIGSAVSITNAIEKGMHEKSIIKQVRNNGQKSAHPTMKPVRLAERIISLISDEGDTVFDPFMGSGAFGVACLNTNRKYIGIELFPEYFELALNAIKKADGIRMNKLF